MSSAPMRSTQSTSVFGSLEIPGLADCNEYYGTIAHHISTNGTNNAGSYILLNSSTEDPLLIEALLLRTPSPQEIHAYEETFRFLRGEKIAFTPTRILTASLETPSTKPHFTTNRGRLFLHGIPLFLKKGFAVKSEIWIDPTKLTCLPIDTLRVSKPNKEGMVLGLDEESSVRLGELMTLYKGSEGAWKFVKGIRNAMGRKSELMRVNRWAEVEVVEAEIKGFLEQLKGLVGVVGDVKELEAKGVTWAGQLKGKDEIVEKEVRTHDEGAVFESFTEVRDSGKDDWVYLHRCGKEGASVKV
ncbi:hypothetical protein HYFRA_00006080 [Hymenoscyphus fraxineus]|uniref:Uncharacterized protein n=1 Tax=Hymenoscyphus fraxineus TaxID=746836 RepID=A0A9N9KYS7_9HELO|nr:hypothetical protein HYFRA_00006080 [Hymenoscyphus fraxineus]